MCWEQSLTKANLPRCCFAHASGTTVTAYPGPRDECRALRGTPALCLLHRAIISLRPERAAVPGVGLAWPPRLSCGAAGADAD